MIRSVFWRSLTLPLRSRPHLFFTGAFLVACWLSTVALVMSFAEDAGTLRASVAAAVNLFSLAFLALSVILGGMSVSRDLSSGMTEICLMLPLSREAYYSAQVAGTIVFLLGAYVFAVSGFCGAAYLFVRTTFPAGTFMLWPEVSSRLLLLPLQFTCVVLSISALTVATSTRYAHYLYWIALTIAVEQVEIVSPHSESAFRFLVVEVLRPLLLGPRYLFIDEAALGSWYAVRALLEGAFGMCLALGLGLIAFASAEVSTRRA